MPFEFPSLIGRLKSQLEKEGFVVEVRQFPSLIGRLKRHNARWKGKLCLERFPSLIGRLKRNRISRNLDMDLFVSIPYR